MSNCSLHASSHTAGRSATPQAQQRRPSVRRGRDLSLNCASIATQHLVHTCRLRQCIAYCCAHVSMAPRCSARLNTPATGVADGGQANSPAPSRSWWSPFGRTSSPARTRFSLLGFGRRPPIPTRIVVPFDLAEAEQLLVVGDTQQLGRWDPQAAPVMQRLQGSLYSHQVNLRPGDYKFKV